MVKKIEILLFVCCPKNSFGVKLEIIGQTETVRPIISIRVISIRVNQWQKKTP